MKNTKLANLKQKHGFTNRTIAKKLGISHIGYYYFESGKRKVSYAMAIKIAAIFNLKPDDIFYEYEKAKTNQS